VKGAWSARALFSRSPTHRTWCWRQESAWEHPALGNPRFCSWHRQRPWLAVSPKGRQL